MGVLRAGKRGVVDCIALYLSEGKEATEDAYEAKEPSHSERQDAGWEDLAKSTGTELEGVLPGKPIRRDVDLDPGPRAILHWRLGGRAYKLGPESGLLVWTEFKG